MKLGRSIILNIFLMGIFTLSLSFCTSKEKKPSVETPPDVTKPSPTEEKLSPPSGLKATAGDKKIEVTWDEVKDTTSYNVYWGTESHKLPKSNSVKDKKYTIEGLTNGTQYFIAVKALKDKMVSDYSEEVSATPTASTTPAPPVTPSLLQPPSPSTQPVAQNSTSPLTDDELKELVNDLNFVFGKYISLGYKSLKENESERNAVTNKLDNIFNKFGRITPDQFKKFDRYDKIAHLVNLYNALSINLLLRNNLEDLHPSLNSKLSDDEKYDSFFNNDPFFHKEYIQLTNIGGLPLNHVSWGLIVGGPIYLSKIKEPKKKTIEDFHNSIEYDKPNPPVPDPQIFFLLSFGSPVGPMLKDFREILEKPPDSIAITGDDLADNQKMKSVISSFLTDKRRGLEFNPKQISGKTFIMSPKLPYLLKAYEKPIRAKYGSLEKFLIEFLPDDRFSTDKQFLKEAVEYEKKVEFTFDMNSELLNPI